MSNGTTATISPVVQEDEMSKVRELFDRAANAIVQASELAKVVGDLRSEVDGLKRDVERMRNQNEMLDQALTTARQARDNALGKLAETESTLSRTISDRDSAQREADNWQRQANDNAEKLHGVTVERDDAQFHVMELQDALDKANAKLAKFKALMAEDEPKPEPALTASPPQALSSSDGDEEDRVEGEPNTAL